MGKDDLTPAMVFRRQLTNLTEATTYLNEAIQNEDPREFLSALREVVDAHGGIAQIAKATGLNREHLYTALSPNGNPQFTTIQKIIAHLGIDIVFKTLSKKKYSVGN